MFNNCPTVVKFHTGRLRADLVDVLHGINDPNSSYTYTNELADEIIKSIVNCYKNKYGYERFHA